MDDNILLAEEDGGTLTLTLNRPGVMNSLNFPLLQALRDRIEAVRFRSDIRDVIITGSGSKAFCAGADLKERLAMSDGEVRRFLSAIRRLFTKIEELPLPVLAAINGVSLGGGTELALACDFRIASENAKFGQPEVNLGVTPGFGGSQRLPRLVGKGLASELLYTGDIIDAKEACRIGLVNRIVPQSQLIDECFAVAKKISMKGPVAVKLCKELVNSGMEMDLARACMYEADLFAMCFTSKDQKEGMTAFLEKRPPEFKGQ